MNDLNTIKLSITGKVKVLNLSKKVPNALKKHKKKNIYQNFGDFGNSF